MLVVVLEELYFFILCTHIILLIDIVMRSSSQLTNVTYLCHVQK